MKIERILRRVIGLIVRTCDPDTIVLFGSHAKGQSTPESDLDLLVIGDFPGSPYLRGREVRELLSRRALGIDLTLITRDELAAAVRSPHGFLGSIIASGQVIYKKRIDKS